MVNSFSFKNIFLPSELDHLVQQFHFFATDQEQRQALNDALHEAFSDYLFNALYEISGDVDERRQMYIEASFHLKKAQKLLQGMPHPAGKMAYRIEKMTQTLEKLVEGNDSFAAQKANRFLEKNLVRRLRDIWLQQTQRPFEANRCSPQDEAQATTDPSATTFLLYCFHTVAEKYPDIEWMQDVDEDLARTMIRAAK